MIPQEKIAAVTPGVARGFRSNRVRRYPQADQGHVVSGFSDRRAGKSVSLEIHPAHQRSRAQDRMHEGGGGRRPGAACLVHQHRGSDFHHRFRGGCAFSSDGRAGSDARCAAGPACIAAVSQRPDHLNTTCMFLMNKGPPLDGFLRKFRAANILPEDESEELFARYAANGRGLPASRSGSGVESQRLVQAGQHTVRRTAPMAGGLGGCFPERPVCRPGGGCESGRHQ